MYSLFSIFNCISMILILEILKEHFTAALNFSPAISSTNLDMEASTISPDPDIVANEPTLKEVVAALTVKKIQKLACCRSLRYTTRTPEMCSWPSEFHPPFHFYPGGLEVQPSSSSSHGTREMA